MIRARRLPAYVIPLLAAAIFLGTVGLSTQVHIDLQPEAHTPFARGIQDAAVRSPPRLGRRVTILIAATTRQVLRTAQVSLALMPGWQVKAKSGNRLTLTASDDCAQVTVTAEVKPGPVGGLTASALMDAVTLDGFRIARDERWGTVDSAGRTLRLLPGAWVINADPFRGVAALPVDGDRSRPLYALIGIQMHSLTACSTETRTRQAAADATWMLRSYRLQPTTS
jgi:hypothetical protein